MDGAAAIVGFVGLAGQILQGCNYLNTFLANVKNAPASVLAISTELNVLTSALETFRGTLLDAQDEAELARLQDPSGALRNCQSAIDNLRKFIDEVAGAHESNSSTGLQSNPTADAHDRKTRLRLVGQRLNVARKGDILKNHELSLQHAKTSLLVVQMNILLISNKDLKRTLDGLPLLVSKKVESTIAQTIVQHAALRASSNLALENLSNNEGDLVTQSKGGQIPSQPQLIRREATERVFPQRKKQHINAKTYNLWFGEIRILSITREHAKEPEGAARGPILSTSQVLKVAFVPNSWLLRMGTTFHSVSYSQGLGDPITNRRLKTFNLVPRDSPIALAINKSDYQTFRRLIYDGRADSSDIIWTPNGVYEEQTLLDFVMERVSWLSWADLAKGSAVELLKIAQLLAASGVSCGASPDNSVLGLAMSGLRGQLNHPLESKWQFAKIILTNSDFDPFGPFTVRYIDDLSFASSGLSLVSQQDDWDITGFMQQCDTYWGIGAWQHFINLGGSQEKWVEEQSISWRKQSSLSRYSKEACLARFGKSFVEEVWPRLYWRERIPPFWRSKEAIRDVFGDDFADELWPYFYWTKELPPFWRSRDLCSQVFGRSFVLNDWPNFYWDQEKPSFWQSRDACKEFFGEFFWTSGAWGLLCWDEGRPSFWRSREACRDEYGEHFVSGSWPRLIGKQAFEVLEGVGSWHQPLPSVSGFAVWPERDRKYWVSMMTQAWRREEKSNRHSRAHCGKQYGLNFAKEQWPDLLREDGVGEDEVLRLTNVDLERDWPPNIELPPSDPYWNIRHASFDDWYGCSHDVEANEAPEEVDSEGWETADEGESHLDH